MRSDNVMKKKLLLSILFTSLLIPLGACSTPEAKHEHVWSRYTDNGDGTHTRTCLKDITHTQTGPHQFHLDSVLVEATDVAPGKERYKCSLCDANEVRVTSPKGNYIFDQEVVADKYLYERCSEHTAIYYKSSKEGAYGNPDYLFEVSDVDGDYTEVESITSDGSQYIDTGISNTSSYKTSINNSGSESLLPSGYQQVEYIESTGTQYIDTGYKISSQKVSIDVKFWQSPDVNDMSLFGSGISGTGYDMVPYTVKSYGKSVFKHWVGTSKGIMPISFADNTPHTAKYEIDNGSISCAADGNNYVETYTGSPVTNLNFYIFGINHANSPFEISTGYKLYYFKLTDNDVLVRDMVPCVRNADGQVGLYDLANRTFYGNSGEGSFLKGNPIDAGGGLLPENYQQLDYIKANGAQTFTLDVIPNGLFTIESKVETTAAKTGALYCARGSDLADRSFSAFLSIGNNAKKVRFDYDTKQAEKTCIDINKPFDIKVTRGQLFIDNKLIHIYEENSFTAAGSLRLFASYHSGINNNITNYLNAKIYSLTIQNELGATIYNFVPCYEKSTMIPGLYDTIGNRFYKSETKKDFIKGNEINDSTSRVPTGYNQLEYIESTGEQTINTEFKFNPETDDIEVTFQSTSLDQNGMLAGSHNSDNHFWLYQYSVSKTVDVYVKTDGVQVGINGIESDTNKHTAVYKNKQYFIDNTQYGEFNKEFKECDYPLYIGSWGDNYFYQGKIYGAKIWRNGELVREFIPCNRNSDDANGLYETKENKFYASDTTVGYARGNTINNNPNSIPAEYQEVEYLQSDGQQAIDTQLLLNLSDNIEINYVIEFLEESNNTFTGGDYYACTSCPRDCPANQKTNVLVTCSNRHRVHYNDGVEKSVLDIVESAKVDNTKFGIFDLGVYGNKWYPNNDTPSHGAKMKLYSLSIKIDNQLVGNYVPCYRRNENIPGLFDTVTNRFLTNCGSGQFVVGDDVKGSYQYEDFSGIEDVDLPTGYHQLAYIRSFGYQNVKTGIVGPAKIEMVGTFSKTGRDQLMGYSDNLAFGVSKDNTYTNTDVIPGEKDKVVFDYQGEKIICSINDTEVINMQPTITEEDKELQLFSIDGKNGVSCKCYSIKIYQNNILVRDLVPVEFTYSKDIGLFDLVNKKFYKSSVMNFESGSDLDLSADTNNINIFIYRGTNEKILQSSVISNYKIFNSLNEIVRDFVPVIRNEDGKAGFFDAVEKQYYESPVGNEFKYGKKVGHHFNNGVVVSSPTHELDGVIEYTCSICGHKVHEKIGRTAYKVEFKVPDYVKNIKIFSEVDPTKFEYSLVGYTRNINTYNYSKTKAYIYFEVVCDGEHDFDISVTNGEIEHVSGNIYRVKNIIHDCVVTIY